MAVKTGTTNDKRDNWAIGWTPNLLVTTWVGNNDNSPMGKIASEYRGLHQYGERSCWQHCLVATNKIFQFLRK